MTRVPVEADNYQGVVPVKGHLLYVKTDAPFYGRDPRTKPTLVIYSIKDRKESTLAEGVDGWAVSRDGSKVLVRIDDALQLVDAKPDAKDAKEKKTVSTKGLMVDRVPAQEWAEIFDEVWRRYRDFFYVENMHGYDWKAIGERYRALLPHVAHRSDLNYVLGEMVAELNVGHAYIEGGDYEIPPRPKVALPGARFELDEKAGRYRVARILAGQNEEEQYRSPLTEVGVDVKVGDYVLEIDGVELRADEDPYRLLRHKTDPVTLTVNAKPTLEGARRTSYRPIASEESLLYLEFVSAARAKVAQLTNGRAGYIHIPDMGAAGGYEFLKWYYPQTDKEGLVVDVRSNGGGNISRWIIERLSRKLLGTRFGRIDGLPDTYPDAVVRGAKVCILNETSASDGDIFPYMFRQAGLGPLVGKRSWGGVVGISGRGPLDRRRPGVRARERHERRARRLGHRGTRRRPRHRGRERAAGRDRGPRPAARARRPGAGQAHGREAGAAAAAAGGPREDTVGTPDRVATACYRCAPWRSTRGSCSPCSRAPPAA